MSSPVGSMEGKQYDNSDVEKSVDVVVDANLAGDNPGEGLQRQLKNRHAQMISIGEHITALFMHGTFTPV